MSATRFNVPLYIYEIAWTGKLAQLSPDEFTAGAVEARIRDPEAYTREWIELGRATSWDIALAHAGLIKFFANRYSQANSPGHPTLSFDDLSQQGFERVAIDAGKYYPKRDDCAPGTYFSTTLRAAMTAYSHDTVSTVRMPIDKRQKLNQVDRLRDHRDPQTGAGVGRDRSFDMAGIRNEKTRRLLERARLLTKEMGSIDTGFSPDLSNPSDNVYSERMISIFDQAPTDDLEKAETLLQAERTRTVLKDSDLSDREKSILEQRFGFNDDPKTLREIGEILNISRDRVRVVEAAALAKLRSPATASKLRQSGRFL